MSGPQEYKTGMHSRPSLCLTHCLLPPMVWNHPTFPVGGAEGGGGGGYSVITISITITDTHVSKQLTCAMMMSVMMMIVLMKMMVMSVT